MVVLQQVAWAASTGRASPGSSHLWLRYETCGDNRHATVSFEASSLNTWMNSGWSDGRSHEGLTPPELRPPPDCGIFLKKPFFLISTGFLMLPHESGFYSGTKGNWQGRAS